MLFHWTRITKSESDLFLCILLKIVSGKKKGSHTVRNKAYLNSFIQIRLKFWSLYLNHLYCYMFIKTDNLNLYQSCYYSIPEIFIFYYKITFWICVSVLWLHKGYYVVIKLVWNLCIKAFWYIKIIVVLCPVSLL